MDVSAKSRAAFKNSRGETYEASAGMKIVIAPNAFKESLSAFEVCEIIEKAFKQVLHGVKIEKVPLADGGDGTLDVIVNAKKGRKKFFKVMGPLPEMKVKAPVGFFKMNGKKTAIIEMAAAAGLRLLPPERRNPMHTTTYGVGELILKALGQGVDQIILAIGGSATVDGGAGILKALGFRFESDRGEVFPCGGELVKIKKIYYPSESFFKKIKNTRLIVACDVQNPLLGKNGAARVYAPQKGASPEEVKILEHGLKNFADLVFKMTGVRVHKIPGGGAAGGIGAFLHAFIGAELVSGFELVSQLVGLEGKVKDADFVITGEGKLDFQTLNGKVPVKVLEVASSYNVPVIAIGGSFGQGVEKLLESGFFLIWPACTFPIQLSDALKFAGKFLFFASRILAILIDKFYKKCMI